MPGSTVRSWRNATNTTTYKHTSHEGGNLGTKLLMSFNSDWISFLFEYHTTSYQMHKVPKLVWSPSYSHSKNRFLNSSLLQKSREKDKTPTNRNFFGKGVVISFLNMYQSPILTIHFSTVLTSCCRCTLGVVEPRRSWFSHKTLEGEGDTDQLGHNEIFAFAENAQRRMCYCSIHNFYTIIQF